MIKLPIINTKVSIIDNKFNKTLAECEKIFMLLTIYLKTSYTLRDSNYL